MFINRTKRAKQHLRSFSYIPQTATDIEFLHSAAQFKQTIIELIRRAKTRIYVTALYWQSDEAGQQILAEIYRAKADNPNLDVKILVDWHRAQRNLLGEAKGRTNADWYTEERTKYGNDAMFFGVPVNGREVFGVLHIKGFVFDDTVLYSGASINNVYLNQLGKYRYDRYQKIKNASLADSLVRFIQQYFLNADSVYALDDASRPKTKEIKAQIKVFRRQLKQAKYTIDSLNEVEYGEELMVTPLFGLGTKHNVLNRTIQDLFVLVQERLTICTPYFNFPRTLQVKIRDLLSDGRKVEIIVGDKTANDFYIPPNQPFRMAGALPYLYERNLRAFCKKFEQDLASGRLTVRLWKDRDNSYHLKGIWVDDRYILLTGNNLNPRAWRLDAENGLLIQDPKQELQVRIQSELNEIRRYTNRVKHYSELEQMEQYPNAVQRLLKRFSRVKADKIVRWIL